MATSYKKTAIKFADDVIKGKKIAGKEIILACERFKKDLERDDLELKTTDPDFVINFTQKIIVHQQGEDLEGNPLQGKPFLLEPWQIFIVYNLFGFFYKGTNKRRYKEGFIEVGRKNGKALSLDTPIPTPLGWKKMGELSVGDYVFARNGKPTKIILESEIFNKKMYLVSFEDGTSIKASADHLWTVTSKNSKRCFKDKTRKERTNYKKVYREKGGWFELTTEDIFKGYKHYRKDGRGTEYKYRVPMCEAVEYPERDLLVDPYTLGVWLGDGSSEANFITCSDEDREQMVANIESFGHKTEWHNRNNRTGGFTIDVGSKWKMSPFTLGLQKLGVMGNKHIPQEYLQSSYEQRLLLLKGLMDTDGFCSKAGQCEFSQKSPTLSYNVLELIRSLGIKATISNRDVFVCGKKCNSYRIQFWTSQEKSCFMLPRKHNRLKAKLNSRMLAKSIVDVKEIAVEPSKCIKVEDGEHLYLAGDGFTATHNTSLISSLALAGSVLMRHSGSKTYIVASALRQTLEAFHFLTFSLHYRGLDKSMAIRDNSFEHSIKYDFGRDDGSLEIIAMPTNPDAQDSFNCNFVIADEVASYKRPAQYNRFKEATSAYENSICLAITTAGDNINGFGYAHQEYCLKVIQGLVNDDSMFVFIARADQDDKGFVDYTNPIQHQKANLNYGVTIRPEAILNDSLQAQNDPLKRKDFLSRRLNIYTSSMKSWFDIEVFKKSDKQYNWTLEELAKLNINWYGGADLSRTNDLTAAALYGKYKDVDIVITHGFFPIVAAAQKSEEDHIPLFGWMDDGWLTLCNNATVNMADIVNWFISMREMGFKIREVGHDRKFAGEEYIPAMQNAGFKIVDQPQYFWAKSQGFRHIEKAALDGKLYYLHSEAYEYCVSNVHAIEKIDDAVQFDKINPTQRIDLFDASVFACIRYAAAETKLAKVKDWF